MSEEIKNEDVETQDVESETEEARSAFEFNPELWMDGLYKDRAASESEVEEEEEPEAAVEEEVKEEEKEEVVAEETVEKLEEATEETAEENKSWESLAEDLNIKAESYNDLIGKINTLKAPAFIDEDDTISGINEVLKLKDEDLLKAYKTYVEGYSEDEADELYTAFEDNGMLKFEIKKARKFFENQKASYIGKIKDNKKENNAKRVEAQEQFTNQIKNIVSKTEKVFDVVAFKDDQKKEVQDYILTGKFQKDVLANPKSLIDFAFFNKYQDIVKKVLTQQGESKGIKSMIANQKPLKSKTNYTVSDKQKSIFDPDKFLSGLYK